MKLNALLAQVEHGRSSYSGLLRDYAGFLSNKQGAFRGEKNTYEAREGFADDSSKRNTTIVQTTVREKFEWFMENATPFINNLFSVEATNSLGAKRVPLVVDGVDFGNLSALELMRLKDILTNSDLDKMFNSIPVRSDGEVWRPCTSNDYEGREIFETEMQKGVTKTTTKYQEILVDPNLSKIDPSRYTPVVTTREKQEEIGDYTRQRFSGEWTQRQKAELLKRKSNLLAAVIVALKEVNDTEQVESELKGESLLDYIVFGNK